jgi:hypothetical protein
MCPPSVVVASGAESVATRAHVHTSAFPFSVLPQFLLYSLEPFDMQSRWSQTEMVRWTSTYRDNDNRYGPSEEEWP